MNKYFENNNFYKVYASILVCAGVLAFLLSSTIQTVVQAGLNVFVKSNSNIVTFAFVFYLLLIVIFWSFREKITAKFAQKYSVKWMLGAIVAGYLFFIISYLSIIISRGISFFSHSFFFIYNKLTSMEILHSEVVFAGILPTPIIHLAGIILLFVLMSFCLLFISIIPRLENINFGRRITYVSLFILSSFMIMKSLIAGGPFCLEAIVGVSFLLLIVYNGSKQSQISSLGIIVGYFVFLTALFLSGYFSFSSAYTYELFLTFTAFLGLTSLYIFYILGPIRLSYLLLILVAIPFLLQVYNRLHSFSYLNQRIDPEAGAYVISRQPIETPGFAFIGSVGNSVFYKYLPGTGTFATVSDILPHTSFSIYSLPVTLPWNTCIPVAPPKERNFKLISEKPLSKLKPSRHLAANIPTMFRF